LNRFIIVDFETTGSHPRHGDSIIQIGAVVIDDGHITDTYSTFVNPGKPIPPFITSLTGITDEMVEHAPSIEDVLPDLLRLLDGRTFVAHNAFFDLQFLQDALLSQGYYAFDGYVLDTVELARILLPMQGGYRLIELASDFDIEHENPHQADSDALATAQLFLLLLEQAKGLPLITIQRLQTLVTSFRSDIQAFLQQIEMERYVNTFETDAAETEAEENVEVFRGIALKKRTRGKRDGAGLPVTDSLFENLLEEVIGGDGTLAGNYHGYERREAQEAMMRAIYTAMQEGSHLLVEAGTGTGKSLGYLLPSVFWAKQNNQQVMISTHTLHLQDQLLYKDIPLLQESLPLSFTAAKLKGRGNYLCLRKFEGSLQGADRHDSHELQLTKAKMTTWLTQTETGDVEEVSLTPSGNLFWQSVKSETNSCLHKKCPWFSRCYYFQAREQARDADLVIINHALLLRDLEEGTRLLPSYEIAIIDEAHQLEEVASQQLGIQYNTVELLHTIDRLSIESERDLLQKLVTELALWKPEEKELLEQKAREVQELYLQIREEAFHWMQLLYQWGMKRGADQNEIGRVTVRYQISDFHGKHARINKLSDSILSRLAAVAREISEWTTSVKQQETSVPYSLQSVVTDCLGALDELQKTMEKWHSLFLREDEESIFWIEIETKSTRKHLYFFKTPMDVSPILKRELFEQKRSVVLTSATLSVKNTFDYFLERYGLAEFPPDRIRTLQLPSPFDYERQGLLLIPTDFPAPGKDQDSAFIEAVIQGCADAVEAAEGRTLILFTSYSMLRQVYDGLKQRWGNQEYLLLGHGIDSSNRSKLVRKFQNEKRAVLLGTSSFWEGVDIPGEALSCLIIVRLPFAPPNTPLFAGRSEKLKEEKKNPFMTLSLPHAIIRLKQGVGRLIRHQNDRGVIVIFDTRIVESRYGRTVLQSLPPYKIESGPWTDLRNAIRPFLYVMHPENLT